MFSCQDVDVWYGAKQAIRKVGVDIGRGQVLAMIGPSGCGKSTFLRCLNRMNDTVPGRGLPVASRSTVRISTIGARTWCGLRTRVGMVFQKPNPFPKSIYENVAYGPRLHGLARNRAALDEIVSSSLRRRRAVGRGEGSTREAWHRSVRRPAATPVHRAHHSGESEVILMDEPCSALDPIATAKVEDLIDELRESYSIVIVTHSMQQAARVSQRTAYFHLGYLIEVARPTASSPIRATS